LLSTESIAQELAQHFGDEAARALAAQWRRYQLEYTWRINSMGEYKPFSEITRGALNHALAESGQTLADSAKDKLMKAYDSLNVFPEIPRAMELLEQRSEDVDAYIFSNGTDEMVGNSVNSSPDLSPYAGRFKSLVTVHGLKVFKPDRRTYTHLVEQTGKSGDAGNVWVVSANPFDVVGAKAAGLKAAWIDRASKGWIDRLDEVRVPTIIAEGVDEAIQAILKY
jgi:2-haloacid dehalogenase